jgi:hypothetical protein
MIILCTRNTIYVHQLVLDECKRWRAGEAKGDQTSLRFCDSCITFVDFLFSFCLEGYLVSSQWLNYSSCPLLSAREEIEHKITIELWKSKLLNLKILKRYSSCNLC